MATSALPVYGNALVKAPNIARLADAGVVFDSAYRNCPLCAPSRFSFLLGRLPSRIGAYDNACDFRPTSRPSRMTCATAATARSWPARCISSDRTSSTPSRSG